MSWHRARGGQDPEVTNDSKAVLLPREDGPILHTMQEKGFVGRQDDGAEQCEQWRNASQS